MVTPIISDNNYPLKMDLANYASLIINLTPAASTIEEKNLTGTEISFESIKLTV